MKALQAFVCCKMREKGHHSSGNGSKKDGLEMIFTNSGGASQSVSVGGGSVKEGEVNLNFVDNPLSRIGSRSKKQKSSRTIKDGLFH